MPTVTKPPCPPHFVLPFSPNGRPFTLNPQLSTLNSPVTSQEKALRDFAAFAAKLNGDEKSEAQIFLLHLLAAFGHNPNTLPEGSIFEYRVRVPGERTKYADFVWPGRTLIEMKSRGVKLSKHYQQTFDYWLHLVPHRPPYVALCNFDEFWIYDFNTQLNEPMDKVPLADLPERHAALNFLFPRAFEPLFAHNWVHVTREAARDVAHAFNSLVARGEDRVRARRFILQCVVAMFAEDIGLLPQDIFTHLLDECRGGASSYDLIGGLFRQMNDPNPARAGRYAGVDYFNGGLLATVDPIELTPPELGPLFGTADENNWGYVQPVIFGTLFEGDLETFGANRIRHAHVGLDSAVRSAYAMKQSEDALAFILGLNLELADEEAMEGKITLPCLPSFISDPSGFITPDCVRPSDTTPGPAEGGGIEFECGEAQ
jgi:hypothetical protein